MASYILWLLFSFQGRIGRMLYFVASMAASMVFFLLQIGLLGRSFSALGQHSFADASAATLASLALTGVFLFAASALIAKRLHDFGYSLWWHFGLLCAVLVGGLLAGVGAATQSPVALLAIPVSGLAGLGSAVLSAMLLFRAGTKGDNAYGAPGAGAPDSSDSEDWAKSIKLPDPASVLRSAPDTGAAYVTANAPMAVSNAPRTFGRRGVRA